MREAMIAAALAVGWLVLVAAAFLGVVWVAATVEPLWPHWASATAFVGITLGVVVLMFCSLSWLTDREWRFWR